MSNDFAGSVRSAADRDALTEWWRASRGMTRIVLAADIHPSGFRVSASTLAVGMHAYKFILALIAVTGPAPRGLTPN